MQNQQVKTTGFDSASAFCIGRPQRPFDYYATFFHPALQPGVAVGYHSAEGMRPFLFEPAHLSVPHWIQSLLRAIWPLSADFHSLHAWLMMDHHTLEGYNDPYSVRSYVAPCRAAAGLGGPGRSGFALGLFRFMCKGVVAWVSPPSKSFAGTTGAQLLAVQSLGLLAAAPLSHAPPFA